MVWRFVDINDIVRVEDDLIVGGYEANRTAYIGRVKHERSLIVGKVFIEGAKGLWILTSSGEEVSYTKFDILTYNQQNCVCQQKPFRY